MGEKQTFTGSVTAVTRHFAETSFCNVFRPPLALGAQNILSKPYLTVNGPKRLAVVSSSRIFMRTTRSTLLCTFYLQVVEVHDAIRPILIRGPRKSESCFELPIAHHGVDETLVEVSKHRRIVLRVCQHFAEQL